MLVYTGMAADILEIFEAFRENKVNCDGDGDEDGGDYGDYGDGDGDGDGDDPLCGPPDDGQESSLARPSLVVVLVPAVFPHMLSIFLFKTRQEAPNNLVVVPRYCLATTASF